jgi:acyl carrier protein
MPSTETLMSPLHDELVDLIAGEALVDKAKLTSRATLADAGLDSVGVVSVMFAVEEKYGVELPEEAFVDAANFGEFLTILEEAIEKKRGA